MELCKIEKRQIHRSIICSADIWAIFAFESDNNWRACVYIDHYQVWNALWNYGDCIPDIESVRNIYVQFTGGFELNDVRRLYLVSEYHYIYRQSLFERDF